MVFSLTDHARFRELKAVLKTAASSLSTEWQGNVYRCVELKWARPEYLISGKGTINHGSRWMRPGESAVVHASSSELIALKESRWAFAHYGIKRPRNNPRLSVEIDVCFHRMANLTQINRILDWPSMEDLLNEDWEKINEGGFETLSQALGRALWQLGFEGLIANSARDRRGRNLLWFPNHLRKASFVNISGHYQLEKWLVKPHA